MDLIKLAKQNLIEDNTLIRFVDFENRKDLIKELNLPENLYYYRYQVGPEITVDKFKDGSTKTQGAVYVSFPHNKKTDILYYSTYFGETTFEPHHGNIEADFGDNNWQRLIEIINEKFKN